MGLILRYRRSLAAVAVVAALAAFALWPRPVPVDVATSSRGPLTVTLDEEGETRVRNRYVVSAPLTGRVLRIGLEPGDTVRRGAVVARIRPEAPALLDARSRAEAEAALAAARASLGRVEAELRRAMSTRDLALVDLRRQRELAAGDLTTAQAIDTAEANARATEEGARASEFAVATARSQVAQAEARLIVPTSQSGDRVVTVSAPVDGLVLKRLRQSESVVNAGEPLVELGNPTADLEIVSDLLSTDAVRVKPGAKAYVEHWGGERALSATVRRVEPSGFTKVSALGVEEQRVNVILDFDDPRTSRALGDGYRVEVRIVMWQADDVIKVPTSALIRQGDRWTVLVLRGDRIRQAAVEVGQRNSDEAQVLSGLEAGLEVVTHPSDQVTEGVRARRR